MKFSQGIFTPKNPEKYIGRGSIRYRSGWELQFMNFLDSHPSIKQWASEAINIPYRDPLTGRNTIYVPDFFIQYVDKLGKILVELIEIKPASQQLLEKVGKSKVNQALYIKNQAKWAAANLYCKHQGITFRVLNENDIYHQGNKR